MEIENEKNPPQEQIHNPQISPSSESSSNPQLKYLSQILGIKINPDELSFFTNIEELSSFISTLKFSDKKKNETKDSLLEDLKSLKQEETLQKYKEEKSKKFSDCVKLNGKTAMFHTAEKDELSPTMHAFYFCDKSKQILPDKDAAEYKNMMTFDHIYSGPFIKDNNEDNNSYNSLFIDNQPHNPHNKNLNRKRKGSNSFNNQKSNKKKKTEKNNNNDEYDNNNNNNNKNGEDMDDSDYYCIKKCIYGRKSKGQAMIECDKCKIWYHMKCMGLTKENFQKYAGDGNQWYCPECKESDVDSKVNSEEAN